MVMTGGRNILVDYYGTNKDGTRNRDTYLDLEILLRSDTATGHAADERSVGGVSSVCYTLLFLHQGNRRIRPVTDTDVSDRYARHRERAQQALAFIEQVPDIPRSAAGRPTATRPGPSSLSSSSSSCPRFSSR
jgi:hypothetical protein